MKKFDIVFIVVFVIVMGTNFYFNNERQKKIDEQTKILLELEDSNKKSYENILRTFDDINKSLDVLESR
jgi:wyosine [tRNA(Phe)-imidazoG37] synthetase (radical SAM superfamily)